VVAVTAIGEQRPDELPAQLVPGEAAVDERAIDEAVGAETDLCDRGVGGRGACGDAQADGPAGQRCPDRQTSDDVTVCGHRVSSLKDQLPRIVYISQNI